jgi:hypothetical protein
LVDSLKELIYFMERSRQFEVSDKLEAERGEYHLEYRAVDTQPAVNEISHAKKAEDNAKEAPQQAEAENEEPLAYKYIFASYAHNDKEVVMPILEELKKRGYRVWYDDNIKPGSEWLTEITNKIQQCGIFMAFVSSSYNKSKNRRNELSYSASLEKKKCITVYLESVELPLDMRPFIGKNENVVRKYEYGNEQDFYNELFGAGRLETQISEPKPELVEKPEPIEKLETVEEPEQTEPKLWEEDAPENTAFNESWGEDEKYIFASYAHNDKDVVMPILEELRKRGYRVWYDNNIIPGSEWSDEIAERIQECGLFVAFISSAYKASDNCCDELSFSIDEKKQRLIVYIEDVQLEKGMKLRVGRSQAIQKFQEVSDEAFYNRMFTAKGISECRKK